MTWHDTITGLVVAALLFVWIRGEIRSTRRLLDDCNHCLHWLLSTHYGRTTIQLCCKCGRTFATHAIEGDEEMPWRAMDHGPYVKHHRNKDRASA